MNRIHLISCLGVENDLPYLPHFIAHYRNLGVRPEMFHIILQTENPASDRLAQAHAILASAEITAAKVWTDPFTTTTMWDERRKLQTRVAKPEDWVISADIDEFHEFPAPLDEIVAWCEKKKYEVVQGPFIDRLAPGGLLAPIPGPETPLNEAFPIQTHIRHLISGHPDKVDIPGSVILMLIRGHVMPHIGGHGVAPEQRFRVSYAYGRPLPQFPEMRNHAFRYDLPFVVHHYKWTHGLVEQMRERLGAYMTPSDRKYTEDQVAFFEATKAVGLNDLPSRDPGRDMSDWRRRVARIRRRHQMHRVRGGLSRAVQRLTRSAGKKTG